MAQDVWRRGLSDSISATLSDLAGAAISQQMASGSHAYAVSVGMGVAIQRPLHCCKKLNFAVICPLKRPLQGADQNVIWCSHRRISSKHVRRKLFTHQLTHASGMHMFINCELCRPFHHGKVTFRKRPIKRPVFTPPIPPSVLRRLLGSWDAAVHFFSDCIEAAVATAIRVGHHPACRRKIASATCTYTRRPRSRSRLYYTSRKGGTAIEKRRFLTLCTVLAVVTQLSTWIIGMLVRGGRCQSATVVTANWVASMIGPVAC